MSDEWETIDEFARDHGVATTTVRLYTAKGLLPPPRKEGRLGWYGPEHRRRLDLVIRLQERGFSLAGIKDLLEAWEEGHGLEDVLGLAHEEQPSGRRLDPATFASLFPSDADREALLEQTLESGAVTPDAEGVELPDAANLRVGLEALRLGVPLHEMLAVYRQVQHDTDRLARRFTVLIERHVWRPLLEQEASAEQREQTREAIAALASGSVAVVAAAMRDAIKRLARETAERYGEDVDALLDERTQPDDRGGASKS